jgi:hypothetical protein
MVRFGLIEFLLDWTYFNIGLSLFTITYPNGEDFRSDSLFAFEYNRETGIFFEFLFITLIGNKENAQ